MVRQFYRGNDVLAANRRQPPEPLRNIDATSWRPTGLPHLETEAFLSNLCIKVQEIGTRICYHGDAHTTAECGPIQLFIVLEGHGTFSDGSVEHAVQRGSLLIARSGMELQFAAGAAVAAGAIHERGAAILRSSLLHAVPAPLDRPLKLACINLSVTSAAERHIFEQLHSALIDHSGDTHIWQTVELLLGEIDRQNIGARSIIESLTKNLLLMAMREHLGKMREDNPLRLLLAEPQIARVINAITASPGQKHSMESLARLAVMTPQAMSRRFETIFAMTPIEYLQHIRLTLAETLLRETDLPVKTIAGKVGFASRSHFSRLFSKFSGCDPTAYRSGQAAAARVPRSLSS